MDIKRINLPTPAWDAGLAKKVADNVAVVLTINQKKIKVNKKKIKDIAKGLAEVAYSIGDTNDADQLSEVFTEDIEKGLTLAEKRRSKKKRLA